MSKPFLIKAPFFTWFLNSATPILLKYELVGGETDGAALVLVCLQVAKSVPHWSRGHIAGLYGRSGTHHRSDRVGCCRRKGVGALNKYSVSHSSQLTWAIPGIAFHHFSTVSNTWLSTKLSWTLDLPDVVFNAVINQYSFQINGLMFLTKFTP